MNITTYIGSDTDISRLGMLPEAQAYFEHLINNALFSVEKGSSAFFVQDAEHMIVLHHTGTEIKSDLNEYQKAGADAIRFVQKQIENHTSDINVSLSVDSSIAPEYHSFIEK
ncbi:MAG: hypothetical protein U9Q15_04095 [Patescibacteria group bacterium]|nr:hypothetical protein [Patescibacteria group bacterium]